MSAETLRRAAGQIRTDWPSCGCDECSDSYTSSATFHRAVADLLSERADAYEEWSGRDVRARVIPHEFTAPFAVARAYLGKSDA